jgi:4-carboxymuconolactone decarboxylase
MEGIDQEALRVATKLMGSEEAAVAYFRKLEAWDPEFGRLTQQFGWAGMYARTVLDDRTRELVAVAALCTLGKTAQLKDHMLMALRFGATKAEVLEVLLQLVVFCGFPTALNGLPVLDAALREFADAGGGERG